MPPSRQKSINPIGIFDSGIGGLTIAHAVANTLPYENIIYFGDTAHLPWGDKSVAAIQAYSIKICDMLSKQHCKLILIACNTASSAAYELVKEYIGQQATVINVIDPVIHHLREYFVGKRVGLIGTHQTIRSNAYKKKIDELNLGITLHALATPLLVPLIEEGYSNHKLLLEVLHSYLEHPELSNLDALILGCTHYPLIKQHIINYYANQLTIIDASTLVANAVKAYLSYQNLLKRENDSRRHFYVSDYTDAFAACAKYFFQENISLERYPLWE